MLIHVNRKVFNALPTEELKKSYIQSCCEHLEIVHDYELDPKDFNEIHIGVLSVVTKNEELISKVGLEAYYNDDYPVKDHVSGYYHRTGTMIVCPFDWSMADERDEDFSYSFFVARSL